MATSDIVAQRLTPKRLSDFQSYMEAKELSQSTQDKYRAALTEYQHFLGDRPLSHGTLVAWRDALLRDGANRPSTINGKLAAVNAFFCSADRRECRVQLLSVQKKSYRDGSRDLNREEYLQLLRSARESGQLEAMLVCEALCSTGIRVSELGYVTVENLRSRSISVYNKGKIRQILFPTALIENLEAYARQSGISSGPVFRDRSGQPLDRFQVWAALKKMADGAGVDPRKVYPHNLRHLFAKEYYSRYKDIVKLADILGHSSVSTTRIYLMETGTEHVRQLDSLDLVPLA